MAVIINILSLSVYGLEAFFQLASQQVEADRHLGGGGCASRCSCLPDSMKPRHILCPTCTEEHHFRSKCRAGAEIDALTTSLVGLTVEQGVEGAPATLNLRNVPYYLLRALNQVDVAQHRASAATTHGHGAAKAAPNPAIRATSEQVEALL